MFKCVTTNKRNASLKQTKTALSNNYESLGNSQGGTAVKLIGRERQPVKLYNKDDNSTSKDSPKRVYLLNSKKTEPSPASIDKNTINVLNFISKKLDMQNNFMTMKDSYGLQNSPSN